MTCFPENISGAAGEAAEKFTLFLSSRTNLSANNTVLWWLEGNVRRRLELTLSCDYVDVVGYKDLYPFSPKFFLWLEALVDIPSFMFHPEGEWHLFERLPIDRPREFYLEQICSQLEYVKKM
jgi:hypothetical protein